MVETRDTRPVAVYIAMASVVGVLLAVQTVNEQFSDDVYQHLAALRELSANPLDPASPFVAAPDTTFLYSPYAVALGLLGKVVGVDPLDLLSIGAAVNLALLLSGLWLFSRSFSAQRWAPHLTLFFSLLAWGVDSWRWSGFLGLNSIGFGLGYPSMFATGLALLALAGLCRWFSSENTWTIVGVAGAAAMIALTHQFTAMWFAIAAIAIVATQPPAVLRARVVWLLAAGVLAITLTLLWPYYSVLALVSHTSESSAAHAEMYRLVLQRGFLLLPGAAAVIIRARRRVRDPLVWMFIGGVTIYASGYVTGLHGLGRVMPLIAISAHVALADLIAGWLIRDDRCTAAWDGIAVIGVAGLVGAGLGLVRMVPRVLLPAALANDERLAPEVEPYSSLSAVLEPTDVVLAPQRMSRVVAAVAARVVVPGALTPLLSDRAARDRDGLLFFSDESSSEDRAAIAERWEASFVVVEPDDLVEYPWLHESYRVVAETDAYVVFSLG